MDSINIGWKKQAASKVDNSNKKYHSQKRLHQKVKIIFLFVGRLKFIIQLESSSKTARTKTKGRTLCSTNNSIGKFSS